MDGEKKTSRGTSGDTGSPGELDAQGVRRLARLARLSLDDAEIAGEVTRLNAVLHAMDTLREAEAKAGELEGAEPMAHAGEASIDGASRLRADEPRPSLPNETLMAMAPETLAPFVRVPKVIGEGGGA